MEIFIKTRKGFSELAQQIKTIINVRDQNCSGPIFGQNRDSLGRGGEYYVFECFGVLVYLLNNADDEENEIFVEEKVDWPYYLYLEPNKFLDNKYKQLMGESKLCLHEMIKHLSAVLTAFDIKNEIGNETGW